jgi:VIT1/CCC1 family predicted Fe2+/Mn2+ transporter
MKQFIKTVTASTGASSKLAREVAIQTMEQLALLDEKSRNRVLARY